MVTPSSPQLAFSPAAQRNRALILDVLNPRIEALLMRQQNNPQLPNSARMRVLEIASGSGQHIEYFASNWPQLDWLPSDYNESVLADIAQRTAHLENVKLPIQLDVCGTWPKIKANIVLVANMFHISPIETVAGFFTGAAQICSDDGFLLTYGPYKMNGQHTATTNAEFDQSLRQRNTLWGIRDIELIESEASKSGFALQETISMPANNYCLVFA